MLETYRKLISGQFDASLSMLALCIDKCPEDSWNAPVVNLAFCQAAFHTLFFTDCYLGQTTADMKGQDFHQANQHHFREYEELEDRKQELMYERQFVVDYLRHCHVKSVSVIAGETPESFQAKCGFEWLQITRAELYLYNIRHIQHHSAQLSLRLRKDHQIDVPWVKHEWREV
jgi:hypothetical protein